MTEYYFAYEGIQVFYSFEVKNVKNINVRITRDGEINVSANKNVPLEVVQNFVESKAEWIFRNLAAVERANEIDGDNLLFEGKTVYFLGELYNLNIIQSKKNYVEKDNININIYCAYTDNQEALTKIYLDWLKQQCNAVFKELLEKLIPKIEEKSIPFPEVYIRNMKTRWGSCIPSKNKIGLNLQLIKADMDSIEQVVLHELIHFIHPNHSKEFYCLLEKYMPDWKARKYNLEYKYKDGI